MRRRTGSRWPLLFLPALLLVAACGVPISAEEITATAESEKTSRQLTIIGDAAVSSRAVAQDTRIAGVATPAAASTLEALSTGTPNPSVTPAASSTPGVSATTTPNASTTTTPNASTTPSGTPGTATPTITPTIQPTAAAPTTDFGAQVVNLVNEYRVANGLSRLRADPYITTAGNSYARLMGTANSFGHTGPDGSTSDGRITAAGYPGCFWGEALSAGQTSAAQAVNTWKDSPPHNAILLSPQAADIGVGYFFAPDSTYKHYWVLMTGRPSCVG